ncbi:MAG TPA: formyltransferase [Candidatus Brocadiia bacterium]|nr:formyltransferase [Candidatus Brocadiia bacterium]
MSVVALAYHEIGCLGLRVLIERGVDVAAVFTYEDNPGENCWFGSVAELARSKGIQTHITEDINAPEWVARLRSIAPDVVFSFYYRHIIKPPIIGIPRFGCVNAHGSLLPKYRGRCPVNWQLVHGETESGMTLHYIVPRADAGDIIAQERVRIGPDDTAIILYYKLLPALEKALSGSLDGILNGTAPRIKQDDSLATKFGGRRPEDGRIDWSRPAREIHNLVRAVAPPWPGAFTESEAGRVMVYFSTPRDSRAQSGALRPGKVVFDEGRILVGTGDGLLELIAYSLPPGSCLKEGMMLGNQRG